jgi:hypothetical protein
MWGPMWGKGEGGVAAPKVMCQALGSKLVCITLAVTEATLLRNCAPEFDQKQIRCNSPVQVLAWHSTAWERGLGLADP